MTTTETRAYAIGLKDGDAELAMMDLTLVLSTALGAILRIPAESEEGHRVRMKAYRAIRRLAVGGGISADDWAEQEAELAYDTGGVLILALIREHAADEARW